MTTFKTIDIRNPSTFVFIIGATGTSSQIPDNEKWVEVPLSTDQNLLFVKEFQPGYDASSIEPSMEFWLKHGLVLVTVGEAKIIAVDEVVAEHGEKAVADLLWHCMGNYRHARWISENTHRGIAGNYAATPPLWEGTPFDAPGANNPHVVTPDQVGIRPTSGETLEGEYVVIDNEV
jgi:hypothetical protein